MERYFIYKKKKFNIETVISGKMVKRKKLKRRDTEVEGGGSGSDVTLSAAENERDSADESDMGAREGANTRRENTNFRPPLARRKDVALQVDRDEDPLDDQGNGGMGSDNDEQAEVMQLDRG